VDIGLAEPAELSGLRLLAEYSDSPLVWYPPDAVVGNILEPDQASFSPGAHDGLEGALVEVEPGVVVKAAHPDGQILSLVDDGAFARTPVPRDVPLTVSAWMSGQTLSDSQRIRVTWRNALGADMGSTDTTFGVSDGLVRRQATVVPPAGAVFASFRFYAAQVAGPAVTVTDRLMPYSPGGGATKVVVHGLADAVLRATEDQQLQSLSFTVSEVG
jgi:hypothetical protein